jgi:hypothetical protein
MLTDKQLSKLLKDYKSNFNFVLVKTLSEAEQFQDYLFITNNVKKGIKIYLDKDSYVVKETALF